MQFKISGLLGKSLFFRTTKTAVRKCSITKEKVIKLAEVNITPTLRLLSFRVSRNFLYFSFAGPQTDLLEFNELCAEDDE